MPDTGMKRVITLPYAITIYISSVLGGGILIAPGLAARVAGQGSIIAWVLLSLLSYPFAYTFARLAMRKPESGGIYSFSREAFGTYVSNAVGWLFLAWFMFGAPANAIAAGYYLSFSIRMTEPEVYLVAGSIIFLACLVNYLGIRFSSRVQLLVIASIILVIITAIITSSTHLNYENYVPIIPGGSFYSIGVASALIIWAFFGYENVPNLAGEVTDPENIFRKSILFSVIMVGILYTSVSIVTIGTASYKSGSGITPFAVLMSSFLGSYGGIATSVIAVVAIFSTANAYVAGMSRVIYSVARSHGLPHWLSHINPRTGAPGRSIILMVSLGLANLAAFYFLGIDLVTAFLVVSGIGGLVYVVGSASAIKLLRERGWRKALPWISLLASAIILSFISYLLLLSAVVVLASLLYTWTVRKGRTSQDTSA